MPTEPKPEPKPFSQTGAAKVPTNPPEFRSFAGSVLQVLECEFSIGQKGEFARLGFRVRGPDWRTVHRSNTSAETIMDQLHAMTPADFPFVALLVLDGRRLYFTDAPATGTAPKREDASQEGGSAAD